MNTSPISIRETHPDFLRYMRRRMRLKRALGNETFSALALTAAVAAALVWANIGDSYSAFWGTQIGFEIGQVTFDLSAGEWVDEGLMALFFLMVGLDVRRELTLGEMRTKERALLPVVAAIGGLIVPALLFLMITRGEEYASAWGSVISTDTAFALGMLALIGPRNAPRLKVFLLALAVVDDIGALSVIAIFYTEDFALVPLLMGAAGLLGVWALQKGHVWRVFPYAVLGIYSWACFYSSGVHATLAGVLIALLMPVYPPRRTDVGLASQAFKLFRQAPQPDLAHNVRSVISYSVPLNQRLSAILPPYVNYIVVPLFALGNAGIVFTADSVESSLTSKLTWGVILGLVVGKAIGITLASLCVLKFVPSARLPGLDIPRIAGVGVLSGMGFTISLLVVGLGVDDPELADEARVGVLLASILALALAWVIFRLGTRLRPLPEVAGSRLSREVDLHTDHVRGNPEAKTTLVVYAPMTLAYREDTIEALTDVREHFGSELRVVMRHHTIDESTMTAALALEAAGAQGKFWDMYDTLAKVDEEIDIESVRGAAEQIGLNVDEFEERIVRQVDRSRIEDDNLDLEDAETGSSPVVYIDSTRFDRPLNSLALMAGITHAQG